MISICRFIRLGLAATLCCAAMPALSVAQDTADSDYQQSKRFNGSAGDTIDMARSRQHLLRAAQRGHGQAQVDLGFIYLNGTGTPKDMAQAFKWFDAAAANQMVLAQCMLGDFYRGGLGGAPQDHAAAVRWYRKTAGASARCASKSQYELYVSYAAGLGVKKDLGKAIEWLQRSADAGNPQAQRALGLAYRSGQGVAANPVLAKQWLLKSREGVAPHEDHEHDDHEKGPGKTAGHVHVH
ncbi:tetratricopeptide repeat protein [Acidovorax sp. CCYZU-2555]|uniref:tetratricopeptide repeat protein n=1 Tax=Acidovorax sp. CCYZU-2555 TaxID=2835042 RepID=UPI001BCBA5A3|nr:tetratricopeptide repeat protein [Acidovorax sp. CCYZU-2555]MBS7778364.1 sel1 repeat family protein [Acidovorax sp. CCYZU-2555]